MQIYGLHLAYVLIKCS